MDRIRKALDLAREERERASDGPAEEAKVVKLLPVAIRYTRTREFPASPALLEANRIINASEPSVPASAFRMLRTQVLQRLEENQWRSLAILSPGSDEGKTTTAINLAISLSSDHRHTVLL